MKVSKLTPAKLKEIEKSLKEGNQFPLWKPKNNENLIGEVVEIKTITTKKGRKEIKSRLVTLETTDGKKLAVWARHIIEEFLKEMAVIVGDIIGIKFLGKKKNYYNYNCVKVSGASPPVKKKRATKKEKK